MSGNPALAAAELRCAADLIKQFSAVLAFSNTSFDLTSFAAMQPARLTAGFFGFYLLADVALTSTLDCGLMQGLWVDATVTVVVVGEWLATVATLNGAFDAVACKVVADVVVGDFKVADCCIALKPFGQVRQAVAIEHCKGDGSTDFIGFFGFGISHELEQVHGAHHAYRYSITPGLSLLALRYDEQVASNGVPRLRDASAVSLSGQELRSRPQPFIPC